MTENIHTKNHKRALYPKTEPKQTDASVLKRRALVVHTPWATPASQCQIKFSSKKTPYENLRNLHQKKGKKSYFDFTDFSIKIKSMKSRINSELVISRKIDKNV